MPFSLFPFAFLILPLVEIAGFVVVGRCIGVFPTLALVVITAIAGSILLRIQGFGVLSRIRADIDAGRTPTRDLVHGVMVTVAGLLLIVPGFVTDTIGILLFIPAVRDFVWNIAKRRVVVVSSASQYQYRGGPPPAKDTGTIDLDAEDYHREPDPDSPWGDGPDDKSPPSSR